MYVGGYTERHKEIYSLSTKKIMNEYERIGTPSDIEIYNKTNRFNSDAYSMQMNPMRNTNIVPFIKFSAR